MQGLGVLQIMIPPHLTELTVLWNELGPNGKRALHALAERLVIGHRKYGDLPIRRWTREALEAALAQCWAARKKPRKT